MWYAWPDTSTHMWIDADFKNTVDSAHLHFKVNCKRQGFKHPLNVHYPHVSCVTIHFALGEDEKYCCIKHITPLQPSAHPI